MLFKKEREEGDCDTVPYMEQVYEQISRASLICGLLGPGVVLLNFWVLIKVLSENKFNNNLFKDKSLEL